MDDALGPTAFDDVLAGRAQLPVFVLTGELGSGKTTMLRRLLGERRLADTAILVNEFGAVGVDQLLIRQVSERVVLLDAGCVCCSVRDDLVESLRELFAACVQRRVPPFARVLIETSGVSDPVPILHTLATDPFLRERFRLGGVATTVDATQSLDALLRREESLRQLAVADRFLVTKTDLAGPGAGDALAAALVRLNPCAGIARADADGVAALAASLAAGGLAPETDAAAGAAGWLERVARARRAAGAASTFAHRPIGPRAAGIEAYALEHPGRLDWDRFLAWVGELLAATPQRVLRLKGVLAVEAQPQPIVVQGVRHVFHPATTLAGPVDDRSRMVLIADNPDRIPRDTLLERLLPRGSALEWKEA